MRLLLDTNVVVSGLLWNGAPAQLIDAARRDEVELCMCRRLLAELARILQRIKFAKVIAAGGITFDQRVLGYTGLTTLEVKA
jgi:putative PIN family toxin of toxin-antitoxin system